MQYVNHLKQGYLFNLKVNNGKEILCDPPQFQEAERTERGIVIFFEHGEGLHLEGEQIQALELYDQTGNRVAYESAVFVRAMPSHLSFSDTRY